MKRLILAISLLTSSLFAQATGDLIIQKVTLTGATEVYLTPTATRLLGLDSSGNPTTVSLVDSLTMPGNELTIGPADSWLLTLPIPDSDTISTEQAGMGWADDRVTIQTPVGALQFYETGDPAESVIYWPGRLQIDTIEANEVTTTFDADQIVSGTFSTLIFQNSNVPPMRQWQDRAADAGAHGLTYGNTGPAGVNEATTPGRYYPIIDVVDDNSTGNYLSGEILEADDLLNGVLPAQSGNSGKYLTTNGTVASWGTVTAGLGGSTGSTDNAVLRADGTGGGTVQTSLVTVDDSGTVTAAGNFVTTAAGVRARDCFLGFYKPAYLAFVSNAAEISMGLYNDVVIDRPDTDTVYIYSTYGGGSKLRIGGDNAVRASYLQLTHDGTDAVLSSSSGGVLLQTGGTTRITITEGGGIIFSGLPGTDPGVSGQLWNDSGTLKISP